MFKASSQKLVPKCDLFSVGSDLDSEVQEQKRLLSRKTTNRRILLYSCAEEKWDKKGIAQSWFKTLLQDLKFKVCLGTEIENYIKHKMGSSVSWQVLFSHEKEFLCFPGTLLNGTHKAQNCRRQRKILQARYQILKLWTVVKKPQQQIFHMKAELWQKYHFNSNVFRVKTQGGNRPKKMDTFH